MSRALSFLTLGLLMGLSVAPALAEDPPPEPVAPAEAEAAVDADRIAAGVTIDGVDVAGLTADEAAAKVTAERVALRLTPMAVQFNNRRFAIKPAAVKYRANVDYTVRVAMLYGRTKDVGEGVNVRLRQSVNRKRLRAILKKRGVQHRRPARNARVLAGKEPRIEQGRPGRALKLRGAERVVVRALTTRTKRARWTLPTKGIAPEVARIPSAVIVDRNTFKLHLLKGTKRETFGIAVGQIGHATPAGSFNVVNKQRNPWWYPPPSPWAAGLSPTPPGPSNPLGTRWMGLSARFIGIHGTPAAGSIGSRASHGCIRLKISDAEYVFEKVDVGTPVVIK